MSRLVRVRTRDYDYVSRFGYGLGFRPFALGNNEAVLARCTVHIHIDYSGAFLGQAVVSC